MDAETVRAMLEQNLELSRSDPEKAHDIYAEDAVLEFPQSGERFEGVENFREWRSDYPANTSFEFREIRGSGDVWVVELSVRYDDGPENFGVSVHEFRGDQIVRETIYVAEGFEAPEWRARWRSER
jgi:ketosteroid isomerase-like protein